jgi:predicted nucleic acid-binding protein
LNTIADTSVWSLILRRGTPSEDPQAQKLLRLIAEGPGVVLLGVIVQEILQGIRNPKHFARIRQDLANFPLLALEREDYVAAAELGNRCLARGVVPSTVDVQIAAACLQHDCALLTCDADFSRLASCCALRLL